MPIQRTARESRDLEPHDQSDVAQSHFRHQPLKTRPIDSRSSGLAQILINDHNALCGPAQSERSFSEAILACGTFRVFEDLMEGALAHIEHRLALEVPRGDLLERGWQNG